MTADEFCQYFKSQMIRIKQLLNKQKISSRTIQDGIKIVVDNKSYTFSIRLGDRNTPDLNNRAESENIMLFVEDLTKILDKWKDKKSYQKMIHMKWEEVSRLQDDHDIILTYKPIIRFSHDTWSRDNEVTLSDHYSDGHVNEEFFYEYNVYLEIIKRTIINNPEKVEVI